MCDVISVFDNINIKVQVIYQQFKSFGHAIVPRGVPALDVSVLEFMLPNKTNYLRSRKQPMIR